jgi:hypothetical protein
MDRYFYKNAETDFKYPEIGVCMEYTEGPTAKISIPIATPSIHLSNLYDNKDLKVSTKNIVSDSSAMHISACTSSNYIEIKLPAIIGRYLG